MSSLVRRDIGRLFVIAVLLSLAEPACGSNQSRDDNEDGSGGENPGGEAGNVSSSGTGMGATGGGGLGPGGASGEGGEASGGVSGRGGASGTTGTGGEAGAAGDGNESGEGGSSGAAGAGGSGGSNSAGAAGSGVAANGGFGGAGTAGTGGANGGSAGSGVSGPCTGLCPMGWIDYPMNPQPMIRVYSDSGYCFSWVGALSGGICGPDNPATFPPVSVNGAAKQCDSRNNLEAGGWPAPRNGGYCFVVDTGTSQGFFISVWQ